ncbi:hypothetical protein BD311DRAFT_299062 [Dichomitus squalens]|uniref:Uncharacterized protein n=1 Tax=Dichomitus squalens TaxID=114155 RepID=A0A4Q9MS96_9APHY|nr:hypothetical protein BD311DRAFT_299062 [Dichomitus squalens]
MHTRSALETTRQRHPRLWEQIVSDIDSWPPAKQTTPQRETRGLLESARWVMVGSDRVHVQSTTHRKLGRRQVHGSIPCQVPGAHITLTRVGNKHI